METAKVIHTSEQRQFSTNRLCSPSAALPTFTWLDLNGSGLSILERLLLEECLWQADSEQRNWILVGTHEALQHRYLTNNDLPIPPYIQQARIKADEAVDNDSIDSASNAIIIVMGIGGKVEQVLNKQHVEQDGIWTIKRFSGGGTVVLDHDSLYTTVIARPEAIPPLQQQQYPGPILQWTTQQLYQPLFSKLAKLQHDKQQEHQEQRQTSSIPKSTSMSTSRGVEQRTMVLDTKSCGVENTGRTLSVYHHATSQPIQEQRQLDTSLTNLMELPLTLQGQDYCLGNRKIGGNAQAIGKVGWLHHTSWLWQYDRAAMARYLSLPTKRPEYRQDRSHDSFLLSMQQHLYPDLRKADFVQQLHQHAATTVQLQVATVREAIAVIRSQGGFKAWLETRSRTSILQSL